MQYSISYSKILYCKSWLPVIVSPLEMSNLIVKISPKKWVNVKSWEALISCHGLLIYKVLKLYWCCLPLFWQQVVSREFPIFLFYYMLLVIIYSGLAGSFNEMSYLRSLGINQSIMQFSVKFGDIISFHV